MLIRTIYNQAINNHIIDNKTYPFGKNGIVIKLPNSIKVGLVAVEVKILESLELEGYQRHAVNLWLLSFYFAGMRLSDVLTMKWSAFHDGRIYYAMNKNLKADSIRIPEKAWSIIQQYKNDPPKHGFVFPELKVLDVLDPYEVQRKISFAGKRLEGNLKEIAKANGIDKKLSMHIARHSFAQIAGDKISIQVLQELYRHSNITTTISYQGNFVKEKTDNALDSVLNF
ncbi:tyrosine-type recombinase/integrase [Daejeonella sp.]|uniref:tyrosine-type recombinase/integrase n=1 Tax=Daejeonella sp. TaxID=2805397 RepID=UPI0030C113AC